jgi:hypothetical protein
VRRESFRFAFAASLPRYSFRFLDGVFSLVLLRVVSFLKSDRFTFSIIREVVLRMEPVNTIVLRHIESVMNEQGYRVFTTEDGKILAMDDSYQVRFKFDPMFTDNDFSCQVLAWTENGLRIRESFNISWTNGEAIRKFIEYIKNL